MSYFTRNPLERLMMQKPHPTPEIRVIVPEGHLCHGCPRLGLYCVHPCHREVSHHSVLHNSGKVVFLCAAF